MLSTMHELTQLIKVSTRVVELKHLAAETTRSFELACSITNLPRRKVAHRMLNLIEAQAANE